MLCDECRAALSARLDGEDGGSPPAAVEAHLTGCVACRVFEAEAARIHRAMRVSPAQPVPDLTAPILRAIGDASPAPVDERVRLLRICLALVALVQLALAIPALVLGDDAGLPTHVARHLGSFTVALAVGLLVVAFRPERAAGLLPVVGALVVCLVGTSVLDVVQGRAAAGGEMGHAPELVGLVAVWLLARGGSTTVPGSTHPVRPVLG